MTYGPMLNIVLLLLNCDSCKQVKAIGLKESVLH